MLIGNDVAQEGRGWKILHRGAVRQGVKARDERDFRLGAVLDHRRRDRRIVEGADRNGNPIRRLIGQRRAAVRAKAALDHIR